MRKANLNFHPKIGSASKPITRDQLASATKITSQSAAKKASMVKASKDSQIGLAQLVDECDKFMEKLNQDKVERQASGLKQKEVQMDNMEEDKTDESEYDDEVVVTVGSDRGASPEPRSAFVMRDDDDDEVTSIPRTSDLRDESKKNADDQLSQLLSATTGPFGDIEDGSIASPFTESKPQTKPAVFKSYLVNEMNDFGDSLFQEEEV